MVAREGYSDIALAMSPEAYYTGIPGTDVSRGMLYGKGKADKLHADTRLYAELDERERQFNEGLAEKIREYDESMAFGKEQFEFFQEQYEDQYGLQKDYLSLAKRKSDTGPGFDIDAFLESLVGGGGGGGYQYPGMTGPSYDQVGGGGDDSPQTPGYYDPNSGDSVFDWLNDQPPRAEPQDDYDYPDWGGIFQQQQPQQEDPYPDFGGQYFQ